MEYSHRAGKTMGLATIGEVQLYKVNNLKDPSIRPEQLA